MSTYQSEGTPLLVNNPPIASNSSIATQEGMAVTGVLSASDPEGDQLTYAVEASPSIGTVVLTDVSTGAFIYTPNIDLFGPDSFSFRASDGNSQSNIATVSVTVNAVNVGPVAEMVIATSNKEVTVSWLYDGAVADVSGYRLYSCRHHPGFGAGRLVVVTGWSRSAWHCVWQYDFVCSTYFCTWGALPVDPHYRISLRVYRRRNGGQFRYWRSGGGGVIPA